MTFRQSTFFHDAMRSAHRDIERKFADQLREFIRDPANYQHGGPMWNGQTIDGTCEEIAVEDPNGPDVTGVDLCAGDDMTGAALYDNYSGELICRVQSKTFTKE